MIPYVLFHSFDVFTIIHYYGTVYTLIHSVTVQFINYTTRSQKNVLLL
jgi:hypothetical protein